MMAARYLDGALPGREALGVPLAGQFAAASRTQVAHHSVSP